MNKLKTYLGAGLIAGGTLLSSCSSNTDKQQFIIKILNPTQEGIKNILSVSDEFSGVFEKGDTIFVKKLGNSTEYGPWYLSNYDKDYKSGIYKVDVEKAVIESSVGEVDSVEESLDTLKNTLGE